MRALIVPSHSSRLAFVNRSLESTRYSPLDSITATNVAQLQPACTYDLGLDVSFQTGPIVVGDILYGTSEKETFAIVPRDEEPASPTSDTAKIAAAIGTFGSMRKQASSAGKPGSRSADQTAVRARRQSCAGFRHEHAARP